MGSAITVDRDVHRRAEQAVRDVLPRSVEVRRAGVGVVVNGQPVQLAWAGEGNLRDVRPMLEDRQGRPAVVVARRLSPGARERLSEAGIGWVDETGAAEIAVGSIVVSRTGRRPARSEELTHWTPAVMAVVEALLCGAKPTVAAAEQATGLSTGSCTKALRLLADRGLLTADAARGRGSARRIVDPDRLLDAYAAAVEQAPASVSVQVGLGGRDLIAALAEAGIQWDAAQVPWAATGAAAASVLAPYLTSVSVAEVFVGADTPLGLEARAADAGVRPMEGGRLTLRPFPTVAIPRLAEHHDGLRVAPWPRVYADLRSSGVRGEEAAEHLREVVGGR